MHLRELETRLNYSFSDKMLLVQALTHRSYGKMNYERLEFLGDSILNAVIAIELFYRFPELEEGRLSRLRAELVREQALLQVSGRLFLSKFLRMGRGEIKSGGRQRISILADVCESLIGAVFLDGGMVAVHGLIHKLFSPLFVQCLNQIDCKDPKTSLQEFCQSKQLGLPIYKINLAQGAAHNQYFQVMCCITALHLKSHGGGKSRQAAEQNAACAMLELIKKNHKS